MSLLWCETIYQLDSYIYKFPQVQDRLILKSNKFIKFSNMTISQNFEIEHLKLFSTKQVISTGKDEICFEIPWIWVSIIMNRLDNISKIQSLISD